MRDPIASNALYQINESTRTRLLVRLGGALLRSSMHRLLLCRRDHPETPRGLTSSELENISEYEPCEYVIVADSRCASAVFFGNSLYMFEGVGLVVPLEISLKDPSKFRFLFSSIVYIFSVFCMIIGVLVSPAPSPLSSSASRVPRSLF